MGTESDSQATANRLIHWIREYASLRIDSYFIDIQNSIPAHVYLDLGDQGFFGMHVPRQYGGLELATCDMLRVIEQIAAIDLSLCTIVIECIQGAHTLNKYAKDSMKIRYLPKLAQGRIFTAGAMTESAAGSNPRAMRSVAIPDSEQGWLLSGNKRWVGMGASADLIAIYVQQLDSEHNWLGMSGFLVPQGADGLEIGPESPTMGLRGFPKNTIYMDNIKVSSEHLLGNVGEGMEIAQDNMMYIRLCLAAASIGTMKHCTQLMYRYAERRTIATGRLSENPVTLVRLSEIVAIIDALDAFIYLISELFDKDPIVVPEELFVAAKILSTEYLGKSVDLLVQMLGARGYEEASGVSKIYRDARVFRIFEGPTEALNMYIGSRVLENNTRLSFFVCETLQQPMLFDEIKGTIQQLNEQCLANNKGHFAKPFSINYWAQSLVGEVITYGLLLCGIESLIKNNYSDDLQRAHLWVRNKYNSVVEHSLVESLGKKVLISSSQIQEIIYKYTDAIGNIQQNRRTQDITIDPLLKNDQENDIHDSTIFTENDTHYEEVRDDNTLVATEDERQLLLHEWNNVENSIMRPNICVYDLFEEQVNKNPDSIAVVFQNESITYSELNDRANRLANFLKIKGISSNQLVAIYMERSLEMIVGLLGVLKAGGAYLPLDHHYPVESLKFMFNDSGARFILSHKKLEKCIPFDLKDVVLYEDVNPNFNEVSLSDHASTGDICYCNLHVRFIRPTQRCDATT